MVLISVIFAALAASTYANPIKPSEIEIERRTDATPGEPSYITNCRKLNNCEVYTDENGKPAYRFKTGMGPGSEYFEQRNFTKRDDGTTSTAISILDKFLQWGCNTNCHDVIGQIISLCPPGETTCDTTPGASVTQAIQVIPEAGGVIRDDTLVFKPDGQWPIWLESGLITAVQITAGANVQMQNNAPFLSSLPVGRGSGGDPVTTQPIPKVCNMASQTSQIDIQRTYNGDLQGFLKVTISSENALKGGLCGTWKGVDEIAGAWAAAIPVVGSVIGAIFGTISGSCDL